MSMSRYPDEPRSDQDVSMPSFVHRGKVIGRRKVIAVLTPENILR
jgi:hypothetical protein